MKKLTFLFGLIVLVNLVSCGENTITNGTDRLADFSDAEKRNSDWIWVKPDKGDGAWIEANKLNPADFNGHFIHFYDNGNMYSDTKCIGGENDTIKMFDTTGILMVTTWRNEYNYERADYEQLGHFEWFHPNLKLRKIGSIIAVDNATYGNQEFLNGEIITFFSNGDTASIENFVDWQFKDGQFRTWHENGQLKSIENFYINARTGLFQEFDLQGNLIKDGHFGFMRGKEREYYLSGALKSEIEYYQYVKTGKARSFSESGGVEITSFYDHDTLVSSDPYKRE